MKDIYYQKYLKYKQKYLQLKYKNIQIGGKSKKNNIIHVNKKIFKKYRKNIINDLKNSYSTLMKNTNIKEINKLNKKMSNIKNVKYNERLSRIKNKSTHRQSREITKNIDDNKIFTMTNLKYEFNKIELNDEYLKKYKNVLKTSWLSKDLYDCGFYEYQYKLHQYVSECGLNRTTQLYGTCWFNVIINACVFGDHFRGRIVQLLHVYENKYGKDKFKRLVDNTLISYKKEKPVPNQKEKLSKSQDTIEYNIFEHIVGIFYKILCQDGLRNTDHTLYDNFNLTNLAISIKSIATKEPINPININEIAYMSLEGIDIMLYIFNKFIDPNYHLIYYNNIDYIYNNPSHFNMITIMLNNDSKKSSACFSFYYDLTIKNLKIDINNNGIDKYIEFAKQENSVNLLNMNNVDFIMLNYEYYDSDKIPLEFYCIVNDTKYLFKLDVSILDVIIEGFDIGHVVNGMICDNKYYIYDSQTNFYYDCDWTNIGDKKNIEKFINYNHIFSADYVFKKIEGTSNIFFQLYDKSSIKKCSLKYHTLFYYNSHLNFSYDKIDCRRQKK